MRNSNRGVDPAAAPGHTDLMISPEEIDRLLDPDRVARSLRLFAEYLDTRALHPTKARDIKIAADMIDGTI